MPRLRVSQMRTLFMLFTTLFSLFLTLPVVAEEEADPAEIAIGERLFMETRFAQYFASRGMGGDPTVGQANYMVCAACHGANGEGNQALNAPRIAGQFDWYTHRQLMNWKNGVRGTHPKDMYGMQMIGMAATLVDETAVKNISAYIANLGK